MIEMFILPLADPHASLAAVGGKGASLARMAAAGLPVPNGFFVTTAAYQAFVAENNLQPAIAAALSEIDIQQPATLEAAAQRIRTLFLSARIPDTVAQAVAQAYSGLAGVDPAVAVRSSATAEDLPEASFAGQQETYLNVHGAESVVAAVRQCWASLWTARAIGYRARQGIGVEGVALAVVVQELVPAESSGILFTADPVSGARAEEVISAAWGLGEAVVGGQVTPDTLRLDKTSGRVTARIIGNKQVMTVAHNGGTTVEPVPQALRLRPVLEDAQAAELARYGERIEALYQRPMDIEWARAGGQVYILQARPITALPGSELELPAPTSWNLPRGVYAAARNNIVELMADPLSPLFATLGRRAVNTSLHRVMSGYGLPDMLPEETIIVINQYAYYNGSLTGRTLLSLFLKAGRIMRTMFTGAVERWTKEGLPHYRQVVESWRSKDWRTFSALELVNGAQQLTEAAIDADCSLLSGVIPAAWITEAVFTAVYDRLIKRRSDPSAPTFLLGYDSLPIRADKSLYDLAQWARRHPALRDYLERTPSPQLAAYDKDILAADDVPLELRQEWRMRLQEHLNEFGHTLYDLDFAHPVPAEDPTPVLEALKLYLRGQGADPYARQQQSEQRRIQAVQMMMQRLTGWRLRVFTRYLARAQTYAPLREDGLAQIGLAYPLIRQLLLELGRRLAQAGVIPMAADIFWLTEADVRLAARQLDTGQQPEQMAIKIPLRKAERAAALRVSPPMMLPQIKLLGLDLGSLKRRGRHAAEGDSISGVPCSPGRVTATARVLHSPVDFSQMMPGDVLVAPITTPAWTPLFALASAVVTDIGGPLSHGSIVAREYGLPAVLGTVVATRRIQSGDTITVDGGEGKVYLRGRGAPAIDWAMPTSKGMYFRGSVVDLMPSPLSPLFASMGLPAIITGVGNAARVLTRSEPALPDDYFLTINSYAYGGFNFGFREWWWVIAHMLPAYPRIMREALPLLRNQVRPRYLRVIADWNGMDRAGLPTGELWRGAQEVLAAAMDYVGVIMFATTGAAAGSEGLFTMLYEKMARRKGDAAAPVFLMGYNSIPVRADKSLYDLSRWCREHQELAAFLVNTPPAQILAALERDSSPDPLSPEVWAEFCRRLQRHLDAFGHLIYELDFAIPLPCDLPAPILENIKMYLRGEGLNPYERQEASQARRRQAAELLLGRLQGPKGWAIRIALTWAQSLAEVREDALADIGLGYPLLRRLLWELGRRFRESGAIEQAGDIYWLERDEAAANVERLVRGEKLPDLTPVVRSRKAFAQEIKAITPPPVLPIGTKRVAGIDVGAFVPASEEGQTAFTLTGAPTSAGRVTAPACVIHGPEDFEQMQQGAVLVAGTTTPAWTPLFAMASAVVTDIGGPLSHGSSVAREYGIPAVMGTGVATRRIRNGQVITVDGGAGTVVLAPA